MTEQPIGVRAVHQPVEEPTIGQLVVDAQRELSALVRDEIQLAKTELKVSVKHGGLAAGLLGGAGFMGVLALVLLSFAATYGLVALGLHVALAFLAVAVAYLLVAGALVLVARGQLRRVGGPVRTKRSLSEAKSVLSRSSGP